MSFFLSIPLSASKKISKTMEEGLDQLKSFNSLLRCMCLDQSNTRRSLLSWFVYFLLAIVVPLVSHLALSCESCDENHSRPYHVVVQLSLSLFATLSFLSLSRWSCKYGLRRFLFLDNLSLSKNHKVLVGCSDQVQRSLKLIFIFVLPCLLAESAYKIWWYITGATKIPYYGNIYASYTISCTLELCSWLYRTSIFFSACVLYRLTCLLQIIRLDDFAQVFHQQTEVGTILKNHLRIRRSLKIISHRFRLFLLLSLGLFTASQFTFLLMTTRATAKVNIFKAGQLTLCYVCLVSSLFICLRSAAKITHKAQSIAGLAAKWHVFATMDSFDDCEGETPRCQATSSDQVLPDTTHSESDDDEGDEDDDLADTKLMPIHAHTISFHKRQALVTYLENNRAGITVFGFTVDRAWLNSVFAIEFALLLWLLNKTIGIS